MCGILKVEFSWLLRQNDGFVMSSAMAVFTQGNQVVLIIRTTIETIDF